jgi:hypothetical protein
MRQDAASLRTLSNLLTDPHEKLRILAFML